MKFCIIGLGRFGQQLAQSLAEHNAEVLAIDADEHEIAAVQNHVTQAICTEIIDSSSLEAIGIEEIDVAIIAIGENIAQSILIAAAQGALQMQSGQIVDSVSGVTGYLLGADLFLSQGVGTQPFYYLLQPSQQNSAKMNLPQQTIQNLFTSTLSTKAPKNMPTPIAVQTAVQ